MVETPWGPPVPENCVVCVPSCELFQAGKVDLLDAVPFFSLLNVPDCVLRRLTTAAVAAPSQLCDGFHPHLSE